MTSDRTDQIQETPPKRFTTSEEFRKEYYPNQRSRKLNEGQKRDNSGPTLL